MHQSELNVQPRGSKRPVAVDSDEEGAGYPKRMKIDDKIDLLIQEFSSMKENCEEVLTLTDKTPLPLGLLRLLRDSFQCNICHIVPLKPPVIITKCCKRLAGCQSCVDQWFSGHDALTKACPVCRQERGYNETMPLRGLDDFLKQLQCVLKDDVEEL